MKGSEVFPKLSVYTALSASAIAGVMMLAPSASIAASVDITATYQQQVQNAYYYRSTDVTTTDGTLLSPDPWYVFCIDGPLDHHSAGTLQSFTATDSYDFRGGASSDWGFATMSYMLDNYYTPFIVDANDGYSDADREANRGFQEAIWDVSYEFDGTAASLAGAVNARPDSYASYYTVMAGLEDAINDGTLTSSYKSSTYNVLVFEDADADMQDWLAFTTGPVALTPVPLPAGAWLLLSGIGAISAVRLKKRGRNTRPDASHV